MMGPDMANLCRFICFWSSYLAIHLGIVPCYDCGTITSLKHQSKEMGSVLNSKFFVKSHLKAVDEV